MFFERGCVRDYIPFTGGTKRSGESIRNLLKDDGVTCGIKFELSILLECINAHVRFRSITWQIGLQKESQIK